MRRRLCGDAQAKVSSTNQYFEQKPTIFSCYADVYNYLIKISEEAGYNIKETLSPLLHFKSNPLSITIEEYHDMCPRVKTSFVDEDMYEAAIKDTKDEENWDDEDV